MKIYKHLTVNDEKLERFDFKSELPMQAYIIENPGILALDNGDFETVEIIESELTLRDGRQSKDTDGRIDLLVGYGPTLYGVVELKKGQLTQQHLEQLEDYLKKRDQLMETYIENSKDSSGQTNKLVGILVGSDIEPALQTKIKQGHSFNEIPIVALTMQRFRGKSGALYVVTDVDAEVKPSKDFTKYQFGGEIFGKGRLVLAIMKELVRNNPGISFDDLEKKFPDKLQGKTFEKVSDAKAMASETGKKRHFLEHDEIIELKDAKVAVSNQWGIGNIDLLLDRARELGFEVKAIEK